MMDRIDQNIVTKKIWVWVFMWKHTDQNKI